MSETTIGACPVCGGEMVPHEQGAACLDVRCTLGLIVIPIRLVHAAALLRAVEALAPYYVKVRASELPSEWVASAQREALDYALGASPVDALIALAGKVGR